MALSPYNRQAKNWSTEYGGEDKKNKPRLFASLQFVTVGSFRRPIEGIPLIKFVRQCLLHVWLQTKNMNPLCSQAVTLSLISLRQVTWGTRVKGVEDEMIVKGVSYHT